MKSFLFTIFLFCISLNTIFSQKKTDSNIFGHVINSDSTHLPFATISIKGTTFGINTDERHYHLTNLPAGKHIIRPRDRV